MAIFYNMIFAIIFAIEFLALVYFGLGISFDHIDNLGKHVKQFGMTTAIILVTLVIYKVCA